MSIKAMVKGWIGVAQVTLAKKIFLSKGFYTDIDSMTILTEGRNYTD